MSGEIPTVAPDSPVPFPANDRADANATPWRRRLPPAAPLRRAAVPEQSEIPSLQLNDDYVCYLCQVGCHENDPRACDHKECKQNWVRFPCCNQYAHLLCWEQDVCRRSNTTCPLCFGPLMFRYSFPNLWEHLNAGVEVGFAEVELPSTPAPPRRRRRRRRRTASEDERPAQRARISASHDLKTAEEVMPAMRARRLRVRRRAVEMQALATEMEAKTRSTVAPLQEMFTHLHSDLMRRAALHRALLDPLELHGFGAEQGVEVFHDSTELSMSAFHATLHLCSTLMAQIGRRHPASLSDADRQQLRDLNWQHQYVLFSLEHRLPFVREVDNEEAN